MSKLFYVWLDCATENTREYTTIRNKAQISAQYALYFSEIAFVSTENLAIVFYDKSYVLL